MKYLLTLINLTLGVIFYLFWGSMIIGVIGILIDIIRTK